MSIYVNRRTMEAAVLNPGAGEACEIEPGWERLFLSDVGDPMYVAFREESGHVVYKADLQTLKVPGLEKPVRLAEWGCRRDVGEVRARIEALENYSAARAKLQVFTIWSSLGHVPQKNLAIHGCGLPTSYVPPETACNRIGCWHDLAAHEQIVDIAGKFRRMKCGQIGCGCEDFEPSPQMELEVMERWHAESVFKGGAK